MSSQSTAKNVVLGIGAGILLVGAVSWSAFYGPQNPATKFLRSAINGQIDPNHPGNSGAAVTFFNCEKKFAQDRFTHVNEYEALQPRSIDTYNSKDTLEKMLRLFPDVIKETEAGASLTVDAMNACRSTIENATGTSDEFKKGVVSGFEQTQSNKELKDAMEKRFSTMADVYRAEMALIDYANKNFASLSLEKTERGDSYLEFGSEDRNNAFNELAAHVDAATKIYVDADSQYKTLAEKLMRGMGINISVDEVQTSFSQD